MDYYLKIPGISGEAKHPQHAGWHTLHAISFKDPKAMADSEVTVKKRRDSSSDRFADALLKRTRFPSVLIDLVNPTDVKRITLEGVRVLVIQKRDAAAAGPDAGFEEITLAFAQRAPQSIDENKLRPQQRLKPLQEIGFLQVPGISGNVTEPPHSGWIELRGVGELTPSRPERTV